MIPAVPLPGGARDGVRDAAQWAGLRMSYTLGTAAKATGRNKTTILRAIKDGKISALRDAASGAWRIEPVELHRVYPAVADATLDATLGNTDAMAALQTRLAVAETEVRLKDEIIAELRRSIALLTDQRAQSPTTVPLPVNDSPAPARRRRWWRPWR